MSAESHVAKIELEAAGWSSGSKGATALAVLPFQSKSRRRQHMGKCVASSGNGGGGGGGFIDDGRSSGRALSNREMRGIR